MMANNVADLIVTTLEQAGVKRIYGIVGDSLNGLTEALRKRRTIEWVHVRHEEVAALEASIAEELDDAEAIRLGEGGEGREHGVNMRFGEYVCQGICEDDRRRGRRAVGSRAARAVRPG